MWKLRREYFRFPGVVALLPALLPMNTTCRIAVFGPYELDLRSGELRKFGNRVKIGGQAFQILCMLLENPGEMVAREDLRTKLWPADTFVDFDHGLNSVVQRLRDCLCDSAATPRWIETIPRRGYRFIGKLEWSDRRMSAEPLAQSPLAEEIENAKAQPATTVQSENFGTEKRTGIRAQIVLATLILAVASLAAVPLVRKVSESRASEQAPTIKSLAVLPFENLSADPNQEYFSDGMTDELITRLAQNPELRVISRTSVMQYKKVHRPLVEVARELGVDGILEGSVERSGNRIHLNAQLIYALHERHLWAESYDRDLNDLASLQSELARTIARQVGLTTTTAPRPERRISPEARDAYLMGRYYWFTSGREEDIRNYLQKAIDLQLDYAAAWSGLADYYFQSAVLGGSRPADVVPLGEAAARKGVTLDDSLPEGHNTMAAAYFCRWELKQAERESARAVELNPNFAEGHHFRGYILDTLNRTNEAIEEQKKSMEWIPSLVPGRSYTRCYGRANLTLL